ncbi:MAG: rRNA maturation RNase YbeY [Thermoanaerobaculia bacterium]
MIVDVQSRVSSAPRAPHVRRLIGRVRRALKASTVRSPESRVELSVLFCGDARMRRLNRVYRGKDKTTDVLAFPAGAGALLGDIVVSVPYASRQARRRGDRPSREIERLLLHGYLHLLGYDHELDGGEMDALEALARRRLGLSDRP